jgi:hypothetical protein
MLEQAGNARELCSGQTWGTEKTNGYNGYLCRERGLSEMRLASGGREVVDVTRKAERQDGCIWS